jgi:hypothetical protein
MGFLMCGWDRNWRDYEEQGLAGQPMVHAASNGFGRHNLQIGDTVYVVGQLDRRMILIGRMPVDAIVSRVQAKRRLGFEPIDKREHIFADVPTSIVSFEREVPEQVVRDLRTVRNARVKFASETEYVLANTALQPMVWLDIDSAQAFDALLVDDLPGELPEDPVIGRRTGPASPAMRRAVKLRAMARVTEHFRDDGWTVVDVSADHPYDLHCSRGGEYLCVEVKGTVGAAARVNLTAGEVRNARAEHPQTALAIVRHIVLDLSGQEPVASGGELIVHAPWQVHDDALEPSAYYYTPPT